MSCNHCCCRTSSEVYNHIKTAVDTNNYYVHINMDIYRVMIWLCFRLMMFWINWVKVTLLNYYTSLVEKVRILLVRFIYSEKDTNFYKISTVDLSNVVTVKSTVKISRKFVAFSEYMNFNKSIGAICWFKIGFNSIPPCWATTVQTLIYVWDLNEGMCESQYI